MTLAFQPSLLDCVEGPNLDRLAPARTTLTRGAWIDVQRRWVRGADPLFERLRDTVPWRGERRQMYERMVDVPRLLAFYDETMPLPDPTVVEMKRALDAHYCAELGEPFATAGLCLYRDGRDSVAWHGDRIGRSSTEDTMVAIIVLGAPRALVLRPRGGGTTVRHDLGHGDLIVMGGSCQRTWEHAVPKTARATRSANQHPVPSLQRALTFEDRCNCSAQSSSPRTRTWSPACSWVSPATMTSPLSLMTKLIQLASGSSARSAIVRPSAGEPRSNGEAMHAVRLIAQPHAE